MKTPATSEDIARLEKQIGELQQTIAQLIDGGRMADGSRPDEILTFAETAQLLKVTSRTLQRWVAAKAIPHFRPSGKAKGDIRFYRSDVLNLAKDTGQKRRRGRTPGRVRII